MGSERERGRDREGDERNSGGKRERYRNKS